MYQTDVSGEAESDRCMMDNLLDKLRSGEVDVKTSRNRSRKQRTEEESEDVSAADLLKGLESM
jgi:hypothetical protein